ncbi:MAG: DUF362 domain-containing protein [Planctomycetes bacterium]|nr:DUF362 domain-containing protein [Planctomycetota bacterium]
MNLANPFLNENDPPLTVVAHGQDAYQNTAKALTDLPLEKIRGKRVLLKPNAGRPAKPGSGVTTDPRVVAAAIDMFRQAGAEVAVGESPITGVKTLEAFETTGIAAVARDRNCPLIDMDARPAVTVEIPNARVLHEIQICPEVLEYEVVVSLPVMKMHMHTGVTLAVKNMKGCLWRRSKVLLHMLPPIEGSEEKPINVAIADMASVLRPHLSIIDGTVGLEGLGPSAGVPKPLGCVVVGTDAFAADAVACQLMGTRAELIPHLRLGAEQGSGIIDLARLQIRPDHWQDWASPFAEPPNNLTMEFPNVKILDNNSCSACQSTLLLFLKHHAKHLLDYFPDQAEVCVAIGKGHTELPDKTLCLGNCTGKHKNAGIFVPGCPPISSEILKVLTGRPDPDGYKE